MALLALVLMMLAISVGTAIAVPARWFGAYVALVIGLAMIAAANPPEPDFSSPLGGLTEALLLTWGMVWAVIIVVKAIFIIARVPARSGKRGYRSIWTIFLALAFLMLWWRPDNHWTESAVVLGAAGTVMIVLKAIVIGLLQPRSAPTNHVIG